jgi:hypothetical protein
MAYAAVAISLGSLGFAVASFWWLHARTGSLGAPRPNAYAFANLTRLRLPLAIFNSGARDLVVADLQLVVTGGPTLQWTTTRSLLRPETDDGFAFATPFAVRGRSTRELIAEFEATSWDPPPATSYRLQLRAMQDGEWRRIADFDWWAPPKGSKTSSYVAYRNEPPA